MKKKSFYSKIKLDGEFVVDERTGKVYRLGSMKRFAPEIIYKEKRGEKDYAYKVQKSGMRDVPVLKETEIKLPRSLIRRLPHKKIKELM
jgi:hypothetical protein